MQRIALHLAITLLLFITTISAKASTIFYAATNIAGTVWQYDYTVQNDSYSDPILGFTVYFNSADYTNLVAVHSPGNWDVIVLQPDLSIPADGLYDAVTTTGGIPPQSSLGGFSVQFQYLGAGHPGSQAFEFYIPEPFQVTLSGMTVDSTDPSGTIPEAQSAWLILLGLVMLGLTKLKHTTISTT